MISGEHRNMKYSGDRRFVNRGETVVASEPTMPPETRDFEASDQQARDASSKQASFDDYRNHSRAVLS
jgi:hypothetical protein